MKIKKSFLVMLPISLTILVGGGYEAHANEVNEVNEVALELKKLDSVLYIDSVEDSGGLPAGLGSLLNWVDAYKSQDVAGTITGVFDDNGTNLILNDDAYNKLNKTTKGNPYKDKVQELVDAGVVLAVCGNDLKSKSLGLSDLLEGVKTTPRGELLAAQISQDGGFVLPSPNAHSGGEN
jgi:intracellular sulfur oxidation DsrE/DsrF family protein